jgi:hypothetical protein
VAHDGLYSIVYFVARDGFRVSLKEGFRMTMSRPKEESDLSQCDSCQGPRITTSIQWVGRYSYRSKRAPIQPSQALIEYLLALFRSGNLFRTCGVICSNKLALYPDGEGQDSGCSSESLALHTLSMASVKRPHHDSTLTYTRMVYVRGLRDVASVQSLFSRLSSLRSSEHGH